MPEASSKREYLIGVDLGGTKILAESLLHSLNVLGKPNPAPKRREDLTLYLNESRGVFRTR